MHHFDIKKKSSLHFMYFTFHTRRTDKNENSLEWKNDESVISGVGELSSTNARFVLKTQNNRIDYL